MVARVGLVVNPAAGRDVRRLTGGASVSDTYGKRRVSDCVLAGVSLAGEPVEVVVAPDSSRIGQRAVEEYEADRDTDGDATDRADATADGAAIADGDATAAHVSARVLDMDLEETAADTRHAAARFRETVDAVVALGGDGTTRDISVELGDVPLLAVSTGTNNVVPTHVDGTVAGAAAAFVAAGTVDADVVTTRHTMLEATTDDGGSVHGLASLGVVDQSFIGTRAVLDPDDFLAGVVSRASRGAIGLPGIAGALTRLAPDDGHGVAMTFDPDTDRGVSAITVPGVVDHLGVADWTRVDPDGEHTVRVDEAVVSADGERELEVQNTTVRIRAVPDGPRLVDVDAVFDAAPLDRD